MNLEFSCFIKLKIFRLMPIARETNKRSTMILEGGINPSLALIVPGMEKNK